MFMYALKDVAPSSAQKLTIRRASSGPVNSCITGVNEPRPSRYGAVTNIFGPIIRPASIILLISRSVKGATLPVVRMVVTPRARYRRGKLFPMLEYIGGDPP